MQDQRPWERPDWISAEPTGEAWVDKLREQHADALNEYEAAVNYVLTIDAKADADARAWRRKVRDAVANGTPVPERERGLAPEVAKATVEVATEDARYAADELAVTCVQILGELRRRRGDFAAHYFSASPALRMALGKGPDGVDQRERERRERQASADGVDDLSDLSLDTSLGENTSTEMEAIA
jgi:hypothetical protein